MCTTPSHFLGHTCVCHVSLFCAQLFVECCNSNESRFKWIFRIGIEVLLEEKKLLQFIETSLDDLVEDIDDLDDEHKVGMQEKKYILYAKKKFDYGILENKCFMVTATEEEVVTDEIY